MMNEVANTHDIIEYAHAWLNKKFRVMGAG